jgi:phage host-nuclease inhibitor protein Gam
MKPFVYTLENEKRIFMVIISIMLLSLVFMSVSYRVVKDKNEEFQQDLAAVSAELDLLVELLPEKDLQISQKEEEIRFLARELKTAINNYDLSKGERDALANRLQKLKTEVKMLKQEVKHYQENEKEKLRLVMLTDTVMHGDSAIEENYRNEIAFLKRTIDELSNRKPGVVVKNKLSAYYFEAMSSDRRSRASKTEYLSINLQLRGDVSYVNGLLRLEVVDPENNLITEKVHKVRASNNEVINIRFVPRLHKFIKGKYLIRLYAADSDFETKTSVVLR